MTTGRGVPQSTTGAMWCGTYSQRGTSNASTGKSSKSANASSGVDVSITGVAVVDMVNHPPHYDFGPHEVIDVIEAWGLPYHLGNVVKYVARAKRKGKELEDLKKASWYLDRYISMIENTKAKAIKEAKSNYTKGFMDD